MPDALNFFEPPNIPAHYENQLTRAFLVVLRMSPAAHQAWLSLVDSNRKLYELPQPWIFDTQRERMVPGAPEGDEWIDGISVLQAADGHAGDGIVQITDRGQVLDAVVRYGDELLIVVETKLAGPVPGRQAQELNVHGAPVRFDGNVRDVRWRDLLAAWYDLVEKEIITGAEQAIMVDFLDFVERNFPRLGPFDRLRQCKHNGFRVRRRLKAILGEIAGGDPTNDWLELPDRNSVTRAILEFHDEDSPQDIRLALYPADTLTQARVLYGRPEAITKLLSLRDVGWKVEPNFHFGFRASGLVGTKTDATVKEYVDHWCANIATTRSLPRKDWDEFMRKLRQLRFADDDDKTEFDHKFTGTSRNYATPRPGLKCYFLWALSEATRLDEQDQLAIAIVEQLNAALRALGEQPHELPGRA